MSNNNKLIDVDDIKKYILPKFFLKDADITMVKIQKNKERFLR